MRQWQSGNQSAKGRITKTGNTLVRKLLVQRAQVVRQRYPDRFALYFPKLGREELMADSRHANKVVTALARKNLIFAYFVWKNRTPFDLERYRQRRLQSATVLSGSNGAVHPVSEAPTTTLSSATTAAELVRLFAR